MAFDDLEYFEFPGDVNEGIEDYILKDLKDEVIDYEIYQNHLGQRCVAVALRDGDLVRGGILLGGVDKFEPVSGGGEMYHTQETVGQLIVAGGDGPVDLEVTEHALDAIALLVERPVMLDLRAAV